MENGSGEGRHFVIYHKNLPLNPLNINKIITGYFFPVKFILPGICLTQAHTKIKINILLYEDYRIVNKILDYLGIDGFKRNVPLPKPLALDDL